MLDALQPLGYSEPTPIQAEAIPVVINGQDVLGCAQTGTGKTAAFALPMIHNLIQQELPQSGRRHPRGLILTPTRELATQIGVNINDYSTKTRLRTTTIFGGVSQNRQVDALRRGVDIVVATPGRLLDLVNQRHLDLGDITTLVLDEADTMLDMGFINDIRKIIAMLPTERQTLFFSATMPPNIVKLSNDILRSPVRIEVARQSSAAETVEQTIYSIRQNDKRDLLVAILKEDDVDSALVFTRTKYGADKVAKHLSVSGIQAEAIHGNKSQPQRDRAMNGFKSGKIRVLVATDIASRGIDVDELSHVINFELPNVPESYVHRIGRTGRAGMSGKALSFCNEADERKYLRDIQNLIQRELPVDASHEWHLEMPPVSTITGATSKKKAGRSGQTQSRSNDGSRGRHAEGRRDRPQGGGRGGNSPGRGPSSRNSDSDRSDSRGARPGNSAGNRSGSDRRPSSSAGQPRKPWEERSNDRKPQTTSSDGRSDNRRSDDRGARGGSPERGGRGPARSDNRQGDRRNDDRPARSGDRRENTRGSAGGSDRPKRQEGRPEQRTGRPHNSGNQGSSNPAKPQKAIFKPSEPSKARRTFGGFFGFGKDE